MAYGARLESVLGASPRGFESPHLRHKSPIQTLVTPYSHTGFRRFFTAAHCGSCFCCACGLVSAARLGGASGANLLRLGATSAAWCARMRLARLAVGLLEVFQQANARRQVSLGDGVLVDVNLLEDGGVE